MKLAPATDDRLKRVYHLRAIVRELRKLAELNDNKALLAAAEMIEQATA